MAALFFGSVLCGCRSGHTSDEPQFWQIQPLDTGGHEVGPLADPVSGRSLTPGQPDIVRPPIFDSSSEGPEMSSSTHPVGDGQTANTAPGTGPDVSDEAKYRDYVAKADVYWKLNSIRKSLLYGPFPSDLAFEIAKTKAELETCTEDANYNRSLQAINHLERGLRHLRDAQSLLVDGIPEVSVPWSLGPGMVQEMLDNGSLPGGAHEGYKSGDTTIPQPSDIEPMFSTPLAMHRSHMEPGPDATTVMLEYAERYHAGPEEMARRELQQAIVKTNELRDALGLRNRKENDDGDSLDVQVTRFSISSVN